MSPLTRALWAEILKLKRTLALWLAIVIPFGIVALQFAMVYQRGGHFTGEAADTWIQFGQQIFLFWALLALPLFIAQGRHCWVDSSTRAISGSISAACRYRVGCTMRSNNWPAWRSSR